MCVSVRVCVGVCVFIFTALIHQIIQIEVVYGDGGVVVDVVYLVQDP